MSGPKIHFPTTKEKEDAIAAFVTRQKLVNTERREAAKVALDALDRLCVVMCGRSRQPYILRALLYSLWNGKPVQLHEVLVLDWEIRKDVCAVVLAFGFEQSDTKFFYTALENAVKKAGQWDWFLSEYYEYRLLEVYAQDCKRASLEAEK